VEALPDIVKNKITILLAMKAQLRDNGRRFQQAEDFLKEQSN
jgi:hypothetical protein